MLSNEVESTDGPAGRGTLRLWGTLKIIIIMRVHAPGECLPRREGMAQELQANAGRARHGMAHSAALQ